MNSSHNTEQQTDLGLWLVRGEDLLQMLRRVQAGDDADLVFAECYANAGDAGDAARLLEE